MLPLPAELQGRDYVTVYSLDFPHWEPTGTASFGTDSLDHPVSFQIYGGIYPKGSKVFILYKGKLTGDNIRDNFVNNAWVYDDLEIMKKHFKEGEHDVLIFRPLESIIRNQHGDAIAAAFEQETYKNSITLSMQHREYALNSIMTSMKFGLGREDITVFLTLVTLP